MTTSYQFYRDLAAEHGTLTPGEDAQLLYVYSHSEDVVVLAQVKREMVLKTIGVALQEVRSRFKERSYLFDDAVAEAILGLGIAVSNIPAHAESFAAVARVVVRRQLVELQRHAGIVKVTRYAYDLKAGRKQVKDAHRRKEAAVTALSQLGVPALSFDAVVNTGSSSNADGDAGICLKDTLEAPVTWAPENLDEHICVSAIREHLDAREAEIIVRRFGLEGHEASSGSEIAAVVGCTPQRVLQIEQVALKKLRQALVTAHG